MRMSSQSNKVNIRRLLSNYTQVKSVLDLDINLGRGSHGIAGYGTTTRTKRWVSVEGFATNSGLLLDGEDRV